MAEEFYQPKMFPKFIQIVFSPGGELFGLDENGDIYRREISGSIVDWVRQIRRGQKHD